MDVNNLKTVFLNKKIMKIIYAHTNNAHLHAQRKNIYAKEPLMNTDAKKQISVSLKKLAILENFVQVHAQSHAKMEKFSVQESLTILILNYKGAQVKMYAT